MSRTRVIAAVAITALLAVLFGWQVHRERLVEACLASGGAWDGRTCGPPSVRPILRRALDRS
jgi:hypothetical protein